MVRPISIQADPPRGARGLRQWIYAFATALIAAVIALPVAQPVAAGADVPSGTLSTYTYDHSHHTAALQHATTERGPPAEYNRHTSYDAVDRWSHGTSVRPYGPTTPATSANPTPTAIAHGALATTATRGQVEVANVRLCDLRGARVAAETGAARGGVYSLRDEAGNVVRTGRTKDLAAREASHANDPVLGDYQFTVEHRTDVYAEQRGLEQSLYDRYPGAQAANGGFNKIRGISPLNPDRDFYMQSGLDFLERMGLG